MRVQFRGLINLGFIHDINQEIDQTKIPDLKDNK